MADIIVEYDGEYPTTCMGTLRIFVDGKEVYNKMYACSSTGSVWFDNEWNEYVVRGELVWIEEEASKFSKEIQEAVREKLSEYEVCCGGCV